MRIWFNFNSTQVMLTIRAGTGGDDVDVLFKPLHTLSTTGVADCIEFGSRPLYIQQLTSNNQRLRMLQHMHCGYGIDD